MVKQKSDWETIVKNMPREQHIAYYLIKKLVDKDIITEDEAFDVISDGLG